MSAAPPPQPPPPATEDFSSLIKAVGHTKKKIITWHNTCLELPQGLYLEDSDLFDWSMCVCVYVRVC